MGTSNNGGLKGRLVSFNNVDKHGEVIKSVRGDFGQVPMYLEHKKELGAIGTMIWNKTDDGVEVSAVFNDTELAKRAKASGRTGLSVGYGVRKSDVNGNEHNDILITEGSLVRNPANDNAFVTFMKSEEKEEEEEEDMALITETELEAKKLELKEREIEIKEKSAKAQADVFGKLGDSIDKMVEQLEKEKSGEIEINDVEDYAKSVTAINDFANVLFDIQSPKEFKTRWVEKSEEVQREKGIENPESIIPAGLLARFTDAFERAGGLLRHCDISPLTDLQVGFDALASTGSYHVMGEEKTGKIKPVLRTLNPEFFYSFIDVPRKVVLMNKAHNANALLDYVMNRLPQQLALGIEQKIVAGAQDEAMKGITTDPWTAKGEAVDYIEATKTALKGVLRSNGVVLVMSPATLAELKFSRDKNGQLNFPATSTVEQIAQGLSVNEIVVVDNVIMGEKESEDKLAFADDLIIALSEKGVQVNMQSGFDSFNDFDIKYNNEQFLTEILIASSLIGRRRAKAVTVKPATEA
ncbi:head maturation protease [Lactococcus phage GE1]|uniref:Putative major capsid protein n=1 Tax=Lactococcus phage GE1 TaxID=1698369 RepID=A0A0N9BAU1_9CAUD|nr:head maturation protease [Lactococcus phage GE1]ALA06986.1 putative major capsid protein [Lactococcus phage GE1]